MRNVWIDEKNCLRGLQALRVTSRGRFRKKPVVIEAMQFTNETKDQVFNWVTCNKSVGTDAEDLPSLTIQTLEGMMVASVDDWIIKGVKGEFYPCKPDIFKETYEEMLEGQ